MSGVDLVKKYFAEIEVIEAEFVPVDNETEGCDATFLSLEIPRAMLREYSRLRTKRNKYPDGVEFWKETGLAEALKNYRGSNPYHGLLSDILDFLNGNLMARYRKSITGDPKRICFSIEEVLPTSP